MSTTTQQKLSDVLGELEPPGGGLAPSKLSDALYPRPFPGIRNGRSPAKLVIDLQGTSNQRSGSCPGDVDRSARLPGYVSTRVENIAYQTTFDIKTRRGNVALNLSSIPAARFDEAREVITEVILAGLGMGRFIKVERLENEKGEPSENVLLGTISAVTIDGLLRSQGVPVIAKFGGLVEMVEGRPVRFTQIIHYDATSIDPLEIFIKGSMTSVRRAASSGDGVIGASFREIPAAALPKVIAIRASIDRIGVGGILMIGVPGRSVLDVPVASGHVGVVVPAGLNSCAAVEESGISTENVAVAIPFDFNELESVG